MSASIVIRTIDTTRGPCTVRTYTPENTGRLDGTLMEQSVSALRATEDLLTSLWSGQTLCGDITARITLTTSRVWPTPSGNIPPLKREKC